MVVNAHRDLYDKVWIPRFRWQLIEWLSKRYPEDVMRFKRMGKKQLYAIYFSVRSLV